MLSPVVSADSVSSNIPNAIELILLKIFSGLSDVSSSRNWPVTFVASSSRISIPTSLLIDSRMISRSFTEIVDLPLILIISYPSRYAPVMLAAMFSSFGSGYSISISLDNFLPSPAVIDRLFSAVSI